MDEEYTFGLNLYECVDSNSWLKVQDTASAAMQAFEKIWGPDAPKSSWGPRMEDLLRNCTYTLIDNQGMTMTEIPSLIEDDAFRQY